MQPYLHARVHNPDDGCLLCQPMAPGHRMCQHDGCDEAAEVQHRRHATAFEYEALPENLKPIDGIAHQAVFTCGDHEPDPICVEGDHAQPTVAQAASACPTCGAVPDAPCIKANSKPRSLPHPGRGGVTAPAAGIRCDHVHREDCAGQGGCACTPSDPAPQRAPRIVTPEPPPGPPPMALPTAGPVARALAERGIDVARIIYAGAVAGEDGKLLLRVTTTVADPVGGDEHDEHGRPVLHTVDLPFDLGLAAGR